MTSLEPSVASSTAVECPNCSRERKIREEYDKIIVQARRDKDALSQKLLELENELKRRGKEERDDEATGENKLNGLTRKAGPNSRTSDVSEGLKTAEVPTHQSIFPSFMHPNVIPNHKDILKNVGKQKKLD